ncbi:transketolase, C-terminal section [Lachnospiraceae bacterium KM106-2]|nr:transketolase, C-terminal section [Lachnospiraceae bacterium KM106-2]
MMELNNRAIRFLARMGARGTFGQALYDMAKDGIDFYATTADLGHASGFDRMVREYPEQVVNVGIAEQNLVGISAGLAKDRTPVFATSWAMFASVRCLDQVRNLMGYMKNNVKLVGLDSGFEWARFGYSHMNPSDIAIMRTIPNIMIVSPCDGMELYKSVYAIAKYKGPVYLRVTGGNLITPIHKEPDFEFELGRAITMQEGEDVVFVACGSILANVMKAAKILEEKKISSTIIDMHTICPIDNEVLDSITDHKLLVTVEEHSVYGGLGSLIAEYYADKEKRPMQLMLGSSNEIPKAGTSEYIAQQYGLLPKQIAESVENKLRG